MKGESMDVLWAPWRFVLMNPWAGDACFMTVVGGIRVIPDHLPGTYDSLSEIFKRQGAERAGSCKG